MEIWGIIFAIIWVILSIFDNFINKKLIDKQNAMTHTFLRCLSVIPFLFLFSLRNWVFKKEAIIYLLIYTVLECINILCRQIAVKKCNVVYVEALSKTKIIFGLLVSYLFAVDILTTKQFIIMIIFVFGLIMMLDFKKMKENKGLTLSGLLLELTSNLFKAFKPFVMKAAVTKGYISNETLGVFSMIIIVVFLAIVFRPKIDLKTLPIKKYSLIGIICGVSMFVSSYAYLWANTNIVNAIGSTTVVIMMISSYIFENKKYSISSIIGSIICMLSIILLVLI